MEFPKMLYKAPGPHDCHGHMLDYRVVDDAKELKEAKSSGWHETTTGAVEAVAKAAADAAKAAENAPPTRAELEAKAKELGIPFNTTTSDDQLNKAIDQKLAK